MKRRKITKADIVQACRDLKAHPERCIDPAVFLQNTELITRIDGVVRFCPIGLAVARRLGHLRFTVDDAWFASPPVYARAWGISDAFVTNGIDGALAAALALPEDA